MELKWLKDFIALAEQGSFSKAAEARFVTQPAFSRRIRSLENWLGVALVDRNQHPTTLTPAGELFTEQARRQLQQIYADRERLQALSRNRAELKIYTQHALAVAFLPRWMNSLQALADNALIRVEAGNLHDTIESFLAGNSDFLLCYASNDIFDQLARPDVQSLQVGVDALVPVSAPDDKGNPLHNPADGGCSRLLSHPPASFFGQLLARSGQLSGDAELQPVYENALSEAQKALALAGHGLAWLPLSLIRTELESGQLLKLSEPLAELPLEVRLSRLQGNGSGAAFWDYLQPLYAGDD